LILQLIALPTYKVMCGDDPPKISKINERGKMDSGILSGIIGGVIAVVICSIVSAKVSNNSKNGQLKFGLIVSGLFWSCLSIILVCSYVVLFTSINQERDFLPLLSLIAGFGIAAIYSFGEAYKVRGKFDSEGIEFHTPWTGSKNEKWSDLESVKFNGAANWYTLTFNSGSKVRLSVLLTGHGLVLAHVKSLGYSIK